MSKYIKLDLGNLHPSTEKELDDLKRILTHTYTYLINNYSYLDEQLLNRTTIISENLEKIKNTGYFNEIIAYYYEYYLFLNRNFYSFVESIIVKPFSDFISEYKNTQFINSVYFISFENLFSLKEINEKVDNSIKNYLYPRISLDKIIDCFEGINNIRNLNNINYFSYTNTDLHTEKIPKVLSITINYDIYYRHILRSWMASTNSFIFDYKKMRYINNSLGIYEIYLNSENKICKINISDYDKIENNLFNEYKFLSTFSDLYDDKHLVLTENLFERTFSISRLILLYYLSEKNNKIKNIYKNIYSNIISDDLEITFDSCISSENVKYSIKKYNDKLISYLQDTNNDYFLKSFFISLYNSNIYFHND